MGPYQYYEVTVAKGVDLNASPADITGGTWSPGFMKHKIHAVWMANHNAIGGAGEVRVDKRVTFASDTGRGDGDIAILVIPNALAAAKVLYKRCSPPVVMEPGTEAVFQLTDATAAGDLGTFGLLVEVVPEEPANMTAMQATA